MSCFAAAATADFKTQWELERYFEACVLVVWYIWPETRSSALLRTSAGPSASGERFALFITASHSTGIPILRVAIALDFTPDRCQHRTAKFREFELITSEEEIAHLFRPEICSMQAYVPGEQPQGGKFIKLNTNENPYPPPAQIFEAIRQAAAAGLERYPDPLGTAFRIKAAEIFGVEPDWILCGNGSDDILTIVTRAIVGKGDKLRLPYPSYILYRTLAQLQGAEFEETFFRPDFSLAPEFSESSARLKLVFLPNPNSPSGTVIAPSELLHLANSLPCGLLVDEAYADFADSNCIDLVKQNPRVLVSRTLSKSYALAGLRFGFLVAQPAIIRMLRKVKDSYNCDALSIAAATAAIHEQQWLMENRHKIIATRRRMTDRLRSIGFAVTESQANFVWCTRSDRSVKPLYEGLKSQRILVRYMNYPAWGDGLRISVGTDDQMEACLAVLESLL